MVPLGATGATLRKACVCDKKGAFMFISLGKWFGLFFFQTNSSDLLCSHYEEESCLHRLLTSVLCRFFSFLLPRETSPPTREKLQK